MLDEWQQLYPLIDVFQLLKNIRGWNLDNPKKRKARENLLQHINQWLEKENARGVSSSSEKGKIFNLLEHNTHVAKTWVDETCFSDAMLPNERNG